MLAMPAGGNMMRENVATTSAELNGVPSWNFTPSRSLNVYDLPSDDTFQLSARSGMIVLRPSAGLKRTRLLYICPRTKRNAPWCTSKCATSAGPAHLSTPPRFGFGSAARARSERTAAPAGAGAFRDHAASAAPAVVPAAVVRKRRRFTFPPRRGCSMSRSSLWFVRGYRTRATARSSTTTLHDVVGRLLQRGLHAGGQRNARDVQHHRHQAVVAYRAHQVDHASLAEGGVHPLKGRVRDLACREQLGDEVVDDRLVLRHAGGTRAGGDGVGDGGLQPGFEGQAAMRVELVLRGPLAASHDDRQLVEARRYRAAEPHERPDPLDEVAQLRAPQERIERPAEAGAARARLDSLRHALLLCRHRLGGQRRESSIAHRYVSAARVAVAARAGELLRPA